MALTFPLPSRRQTRVIAVGDLALGGDNPILVQTMTTTDTLDVGATVKQIQKCVSAGAELMRLTVPSAKHALAFGAIKSGLYKRGVKIPLIADIHFSPAAAFAVLEFADKIRLNPGNFLEPAKSWQKKIFTAREYDLELKLLAEKLTPFIAAVKKRGIPLRIGANHGSLSDRVLSRWGDTPRGMVESALEYARIFRRQGFENLVIGIKAADPLLMLEANLSLVQAMKEEEMDYPLHLGVTEAGNAEEGRAKSAIGLGPLLLEGIGDTVRVSLTEAPEKELPVAYALLQATRRRITKTEFISCPSCGRTLFDLESTTNTIKAATGHLRGVRIAVMGCVVNGLGEMADADFGYVGGKPGKINLYCGKTLVKKDVAEKNALSELINLIKSSGQWREPNVSPDAPRG